ncbi:MAG: NAD(P)H-hydrate dehydratase [Bacillota bacterium]|nr:NAD(P)H-hydrate dehydratase [Bacillota bacterium]
MRLVTSAEVRDIDRRATDEYGVPGLILMENAGRQVFAAAAETLGGESRLAGKLVVVICGRGNNGGDGFVAARHLLLRGVRVKLFLAADPQTVAGDARVNLEIWERFGQKMYTERDKNFHQALQLTLMQADLVIDALYGTGFKGVLKDRAAKVAEAVNASGRPVIAVDIPSGVDADTGAVRGPAVRAARTVTMGLPKPGLYLYPGAEYTGEITVADISLPPPLLSGGSRFLLTADLVREWLPPRSPQAHKGDFGRVLLVAGSRGMAGAARLAAAGALRAGAGLVTLAVPAGLQPVVAAGLTEAMTLGLPETVEGSLSLAAYDALAPSTALATVLALGPGLSTHPETVEVVRRLVQETSLPCVVDADGLNALALGALELRSRKGRAPLILTPHPGEMARLVGRPAGEVQADRTGTATRGAAEWNAVVVLKGARTVIAGPDGTTYLNPTGNPGMASGGMGDVLTGIIAGLLAQGLDPLRAAAAGVYLHGRAGDLAVAARGGEPRGLLAGDLLAALPYTLQP